MSSAPEAGEKNLKQISMDIFSWPRETAGKSPTMSQNPRDSPSTGVTETSSSAPVQQLNLAQQSVSTPNFAEFHRFQSLPPEIRHMIWRLHYDQSPRIVRLIHPTPTVPRKKNTRPYWLSKSPSLLRVNRESRTIGKQLYGPRFTALRARNVVLFNYDTDVFDFTGTYYEEPGQMPRRNEWSSIRKAIVSGPNVASRLSGLKEVWIVSECKSTAYTQHVCNHKGKDICYVKLENQAEPPHDKKYSFKSQPRAVLQAGKGEWDQKIKYSSDPKIQKLKSKKTHHVSPCVLRKKGYAHWGGEDGCGDDKKL